MYSSRRKSFWQRVPWVWVIFTILLMSILVGISYQPGQSISQFLSRLAMNTITIGGLLVIPGLAAWAIIRFFIRNTG
jgi:hypothetical protein